MEFCFAPDAHHRSPLQSNFHFILMRNVKTHWCAGEEKCRLIYPRLKVPTRDCSQQMHKNLAPKSISDFSLHNLTVPLQFVTAMPDIYVRALTDELIFHLVLCRKIDNTRVKKSAEA